MTQPQDTTTPLRRGLEFVEHTQDFFSLHRGTFHLFLFLELLTVAYAETHRVSQTPRAYQKTSSGARNISLDQDEWDMAEYAYRKGDDMAHVAGVDTRYEYF
jgi:hypothetical protein